MASQGFAQERGCRFFRQNIILSTLSGKPVEISDIRPQAMRPGLDAYEGNFLKLISRLTNGCKIEINDTGTGVKYWPGIIVGGTFTHDCNIARGIGYWLEALLCLAPFAKKPTEVTLLGITNMQQDLGVDTIRTISIPILKRFGVDCSLRIVARGAEPLGGGKVVFSCTPVRKLEMFEMLDTGKIKRIRGLAYSARVSPDIANRAVHAAKGVFLKFLPDIFVTADHFSGDQAGLSPGYGITLIAESHTKTLFMAEDWASDSKQLNADNATPEDIGAMVSKLLLEQIRSGGCIDSSHQALVMLFMALSPEHLCRVLMGRLTEYSENMQRLLEYHFGVTFSVVKKKRPELDDDMPPVAIVSCVGSNYINLAKRSA